MPLPVQRFPLRSSPRPAKSAKGMLMGHLFPRLDLGLLAMVNSEIYWRDLPILIVVVSLVYGATRYDDWAHILREGIRWVVRLTAFLVAVMLILFVVARLFS